MTNYDDDSLIKFFEKRIAENVEVNEKLYEALEELIKESEEE